MCVSPISVKRVYNGKEVYDEVPCGKCAECNKSLQNFWFVRFVEEAKQWKNVFFVTYEYDNKHLPYLELGDAFISQFEWELHDFSDEVAALQERALSVIKKGLANLKRIGSKPYLYNKYHPTPYNEYLFFNRLSGSSYIPYLRKSDLADHFKRVRRNFERLNGRKLDIKYFVQGEYGPNTLRPHWHGLLFTNECISDLKELICADWEKYNGADIRFWFQPVVSKDATAKYCSKYVVKPVEFENPYVVAGVLPSPPRVVSKGIGEKYRAASCTQEVKDKVAAVSTVEEYEMLYPLYFFYYYRTKKGVFQYMKPRYWLEPLYPMVEKIADTYTYVVRESGRKITFRRYLELKKKLGDSIDEKISCLFDEGNRVNRSLDRESPFGKQREIVVRRRIEERNRALLQRAEALSVHFSNTTMLELVYTLEALDANERRLSALAKHAEFYQACSLRSDF